jgi:hypothetical protein
MAGTAQMARNEVAEAARADIQAVVRGVLALVGLQFVRTFAAALPGSEQMFGSLSARDWMFVLFGLMVLAVLAGLYRPASRAVMFYLRLGVSAAPARGRERYRPLLAAPLQIAVQLAFLGFAYDQVPPLLTRIGPLVQGAPGLIALVQGVALLIGLLLLVSLWRALRPLLDALAADAGEAIAAVSLGVAFVKCPKCLTETERDGAFCRNCGAGRDETPVIVVCGACQRGNPADVRYCPGCGTEAGRGAPARLTGT